MIVELKASLPLHLEHTPEQALIPLLNKILGQRAPASAITSLKGGLTNQLYLFEDSSGDKYLLRAFGSGTQSFIDRDREFAVHSELTTLNLAPELIGRFSNGLVYRYVPGRALSFEELSLPAVRESVAARLAQWHVTLRPEAVAARLPANHDLGNLWSILNTWVSLVPDGILPLSREELLTEVNWIRANIGTKGGPIVMGHCDLLSGNILCPEEFDVNQPCSETAESKFTFIDYEYAMPCPRAFDIANHFMEWQGFDCEVQRLPQPNSSCGPLVHWIECYRAAQAQIGSTTSSLEDNLRELACWWGMPGFYWALWAAIQARSSDIDFGYDKYALKRFVEYKDWKTRLWPSLASKL